MVDFNFLIFVQVFLDKESKRARVHDPSDYLECLDLYLKKLVLINYRGIKRDVEFAKFFILKARVLKMMELATRRQSCDSKYLTTQGTKLQLKSRASKDAQVLFSCHNYSNDSMYIRHMHDLSIGDPFDQSLCSCKSFQFLWAGMLQTIDGILMVSAYIQETLTTSDRMYSVHLCSHCIDILSGVTLFCYLYQAIQVSVPTFSSLLCVSYLSRRCLSNSMNWASNHSLRSNCISTRAWKLN